MKYDKKILITGILLVVFVVLAITGLTYAFFTAQIEGNEEAKNTVIEVANLRLVFEDTIEITLDDILPGTSVTKEFTIENTGNRKINYEINLKDVINTFINNELVYSLESTNGGANVTDVPILTSDGALVEAGINPYIKQTYTITIKFKETGQDQNHNQGAIFNGKLQINPKFVYSNEVVFSIENTIGEILSGAKTQVSLTGTYYGMVSCSSADENIAECQAGYEEVSITGKNPGTTNITITEDSQQMEVIYTITVKKSENAPVLIAGMTPVKWTGTPGNYVETTTTEDDPEWYNYSQKKWANAKTADGSYWVWIPRYAYKITSGYHSSTTGTIDIKFLTGKTNTTPDGTIIETSGYNYGVKDTNTNYFLHPAFTFGIDEVTGIWVAKYEASVANQSDACYTAESSTNCNKNTLIPAFKPNVKSWRYIQVGNAFDVAYNLKSKSNYGWQSSNIDTHMIKNTEWGAVVYLAQSKYGANQEIYINNSSTFTTGCAGNSVSEASYAGCQNAYNTANGVKASTTHNITGIYDISGGVYEYTTAYVNNGNGNLTTYGSQIISANSKYKDIYTAGTGNTQYENYEANKNKYGDAVYETSGLYKEYNSWNADSSYMLSSTSPWFARGGNYSYATSAGAFSFINAAGATGSNNGFRVSALIPGS